MDIDKLTKTQFVLLILLVSFVTSLATAIITATLVKQAPPLFTQSITKVIERLKPEQQEKSVISPVQPIIITQEDLIVKLVSETSPAVASIIATKDLPVIEQYFVNPFENDELFKRFFGEGLSPDFKIPQYRQKGVEPQQVSSGTGFFVSADGLLLTNRHVVEDKEASYSVVMNDGRKFEAKVLARDPFYDIAILKVEAGQVSFIKLGDSNKLKTGQTVVAIGNALGEFQNTVSMGVISGLRRTVTAIGSAKGPEVLQDVIQTDAAINPGNSGGPLLDLNGHAIGLNVATAKGAENIGFSLPINLVKKAIEDVKTLGKISYPFLGVRYAIITPELQKEKNLPVDYGTLVSEVIDKSPAKELGLKKDDIILEFSGEKINKENSLAKLISKNKVGDTVELRVLKDGKQEILKTILAEVPENL